MSVAKRPSTQFGEPLSEESLRLVREVRRQLQLPVHRNFDSDFNLYRFVANAERTQKSRKEVVDTAARALNQHLRVRSCLRLDEVPDVPFHQNRLFRQRFLPTGPILDGTDAQNRILWFIEYRSLSVETIAHGIRSSESIRCQFWQFEHMLRRVNEQERRSGRLSSIRHVVDMAGYELNPFTFGFLSSGTLSYYSQLLHYDNYPELVYPIEMVNIAKWIHIPYRLIKAMMPAGFTDRFRLHDGDFLDALSTEIPLEHIPQTLGGQNPVRCIPAQKLLPAQYWQPQHPDILAQLETLHIGPRKSKLLRIEVEPSTNSHPKQQQQLISWYFRTDGDIFFGIFYEPPSDGSAAMNGHCQKQSPNGKGNTNKEKESIGGPVPMELMETRLEWTYPLFKLTAKIHHEWDCVDCSRPGTYWLMFSNRHCWLHRRTVEVVVQMGGADEGGRCAPRRIWHSGEQQQQTQLETANADLDLRIRLGLDPAHMFGPRVEELEEEREDEEEEEENEEYVDC